MKHPIQISFIVDNTLLNTGLGGELELELEYGQTVDDLKAEITNKTGVRDFILLNIHNKPFPLSMPFRHNTIVKIELKSSICNEQN